MVYKMNEKYKGLTLTEIEERVFDFVQAIPEDVPAWTVYDMLVDEGLIAYKIEDLRHAETAETIIEEIEWNGAWCNFILVDPTADNDEGDEDDYIDRWEDYKERWSEWYNSR